MTDTFATPAYLAPPLVLTGLSFVLAFVVLRDNWRRTTHRLLSLLILNMGLWGVVIFCMRFSPDLDYARVWDKIALPLGFLVPALYYHFTLAYTGVRYRKSALLVVYFLPILAVALAPGSLLIEDMSLQDYGYGPNFGPLMLVLIALVYVELGAAIYNLTRAYRLSAVYSERNRLLYMSIAIVFPMIGGVIELFPTTYPTTMFGNLLFCAVTALAILRYHLLDIHVVLRKGVAYLLMSALVAVPYVGIIVGANRIIETGDIALWIHVVVLLALAAGLLPLWGRVQRLVDRWFYRERYGHLRTLAEFSQGAHGISDLDELGTSLVRLIGRALQTSGVYLLGPSASGDFNLISSAGASDVQLGVEARSPLVQWLRERDGVLRGRDLDIFPQLQAVPGREREELRRIGAQIYVPLKTKENELVGVLILGESLSGQPYSQEDERLVYTVASRMAVELENARLYNMERVARGELQRQNEQKTEFLHSVAHELKTPLTAIISSSELLQVDGGTVTSEQRQQMLRNISKGGWGMDRRISELLDFARMQTAALELQMRPLEVSLVIREVGSQLNVLFNNRGQSLNLEVPDSLPQVNADRAKLEQILINLLENANKFSPQGGSITLRAIEVDAKVVVEVEDSAPAITDQERSRVFDPYYRGEDADRRQRLSGIGLGLAITKRLVEAHQGEIWVESRSEGGNTFSFSLPTLSLDQGEAGGDGRSSTESGG